MNVMITLLRIYVIIMSIMLTRHHEFDDYYHP